jgi:tetratricopeptide (TPR) repeat protein
MALRLDPTFARAYSGVSFTHFQNAFQGWAESAPEMERAYAAAAESLMADDRDPAAHWAKGRALWLRGRHDQSLQELEQAVELSPNFAMAHYTLGFVRSQSGDALAAIASADLARQLSPFDPMLFAMLAARAMALIRLNRIDEACDSAVRPRRGAEPLCYPYSGACGAARPWPVDGGCALRVGVLRKASPTYGLSDFFAAFQLDEAGRRHFRRAAGLL